MESISQAEKRTSVVNTMGEVRGGERERELRVS